MVSYRRLVVSCLTAFFLNSCAISQSPQELFEEIKPSIVLITYKHTGGHRTGFFVEGEPGFCMVLTSYHNLPLNDTLNFSQNDTIIASTSIVQKLPDLDLAIAIFKPKDSKDCPYKPLQLGDSDKVEIGQSIRIIGYPERVGEENLVLQFPGGQITSVIDQPFPDGYKISYEATTVSGMSGAPVVNGAGKVIAVHGKTDREIIKLARTQSSSLSIQQQEKVEEIDQRIDREETINHFKWGIPINIFNKAPTTAAEWTSFGLGLYSKKRYTDALEAYENAININPKYKDAWFRERYSSI